jgi:hypothetical protein
LNYQIYITFLKKIQIKKLEGFGVRLAILQFIEKIWIGFEFPLGTKSGL